MRPALAKILFKRKPRASLDLPLQAALIPRYADGSSTPTYTNATVRKMTDFEGLQKDVLSGEFRPQGARRVHNLVANSEVLTAAGGWTLSNATSVVGATDPEGGTTAYTVTATSAVGQIFNNTLTPANSLVVPSIWIKRLVGTGTIYIHNGARTPIDITSQVTTSWKRFATTAASHASGSVVNPRIDTSGDAIAIWHPMMEQVTGQTNVAPSEYVSVGVLAAPFHGAGVDGVKFFQTLNANSVSSNVVTEAVGANINSAAAECAGGVTAGVVDANGPFGYLAEGARTNSILQSNTLGTTWTVSNAADMNVVGDNIYVGVDGHTTMDRLQPKATTAIHSLNQAFTFTATRYTSSADFRYVSATPQRWVAIICNDGTTTWGASFDLLNGVVGAVSAGATSTIAATGQANVYSCSVTNTANAAAAAGTVKISLNATDTATLENALRAGTETLGAGFAQHEVGIFKSSRIVTTTVAVARNIDVEQHVSSGNLGTNNITIAGESAFPVIPTAASYFLFGSFVDASNYTAVLWDGTNLIARKRIAGANTDATVALSPTANTVFKWAARFSTVTGIDIFLNGVIGTNHTDVATCQIGTNFQIGADGNGANAAFATTRNFKSFSRALTAVQIGKI